MNAEKLPRSRREAAKTQDRRLCRSLGGSNGCGQASDGSVSFAAMQTCRCQQPQHWPLAWPRCQWCCEPAADVNSAVSARPDATNNERGRGTPPPPSVTGWQAAIREEALRRRDCSRGSRRWRSTSSRRPRGNNQRRSIGTVTIPPTHPAQQAAMVPWYCGVLLHRRRVSSDDAADGDDAAAKVQTLVEERGQLF